MAGCGCGAAQAAARQQLDNGSVDGTLKVLTEIVNPYAALTAPPASAPTAKVSTTDYSSGVFVQTGKKANGR